MGTCSHISLRKYKCPNNTFISDKCLLHSKDSEEYKNKQTGQLQREFDNILNNMGKAVIIANIQFPPNFNLKLPDNLDKRIIFFDCQYPKDLEISKINAKNTIIFHKFIVKGNFTISQSTFNSQLIMHNCHITGNLNISHLKGSNLYLRLTEINSVRHLLIEDVDFTKGAKISSVGLHDSLRIVNSKFHAKSILKFPLSTIDRRTLINCDFIGITEIDWGWKSGLRVNPKSGGGINFQTCKIDGLVVRNFDRNRAEMVGPLLQKTAKNAISLFRKFANNINDIDALVHFSRSMKNIFFNTAHIEIYDHYYILEQYYSRLLPSYGRGKKIVNFFYRHFSFYGYSIWKPILWLFGFLFFFNILYFLNGVNCNSFAECSKEFCCTFARHLEQISFFRSETVWMPPGSPKRIIFIIETIILIPIISCIVISIRKVFRRQ